MSWAEVQKIKETVGVAPSFLPVCFYDKVSDGYLLYWSDPNDTIIENQLLVTWKGTKILRKQGSIPQNSYDGTVVVNNRQRNRYATSPLKDTVSGNDWYYMAFPYSMNDAITINERNIFQERSSSSSSTAKMHGIRIDKTIVNPYEAVTYIYDSVGMVPALSYSDMGSWLDEWFMELPLVMTDSNGSVIGEVNESDIRYFSNGTSTGVFDASTRNTLMVGLPRVYWYFYEDSDAYYALFSNEPFPNSWIYTHTRINGTIAAYKYLAPLGSRIVTDTVPIIVDTGVYSAGSSVLVQRLKQKASQSTWMSALSNMSSSYTTVAKVDLDLLLMLQILITKSMNPEMLWITPPSSSPSTTALPKYSPTTAFRLTVLFSALEGYMVGGFAIRPDTVTGNIKFYYKSTPPYDINLTGYVEDSYTFTALDLNKTNPVRTYGIREVRAVDGMLFPKIVSNQIQAIPLSYSNRQNPTANTNIYQVPPNLYPGSTLYTIDNTVYTFFNFTNPISTVASSQMCILGQQYTQDRLLLSLLTYSTYHLTRPNYSTQFLYSSGSGSAGYVTGYDASDSLAQPYFFLAQFSEEDGE